MLRNGLFIICLCLACPLTGCGDDEPSGPRPPMDSGAHARDSDAPAQHDGGHHEAGSDGEVSSSSEDGGSGNATTGDGGDAGNTGNARDAGSDGGSSDSGNAGVRQVPPTGEDALEAWLAMGEYESWHCEAARHPSRMPSAHGYNRICSNDAIHESATGNGPWPVGAAAVKEMFLTMDEAVPSGYAVYIKMSDQGGEADGDDWYWYERYPNSGGGVVLADGMGVALCTDCHDLAGTNADNTPSPGARDEVFTPVQ